MIENEPRELTLIYHSEKSDDKKARAYVESFPSLTIKTLDLARENLTETQLAQIAAKMQVPIEELVDITYDDRSTKPANGKRQTNGQCRIINTYSDTIQNCLQLQYLLSAIKHINTRRVIN